MQRSADYTEEIRRCVIINQDERDELLSSQIMAWCKSYFQLVACAAVFKAYHEPLERKSICNMFNSEMNTMLRRASKFRDYLSEECYTCVCASIHELKDDAQYAVMKHLEKEDII